MTDFTLGPGPLTPEFEQVKSDIGIVENGNTATHAIPSGYYVIWKGDLYVAKTDISSGTALSAESNGNLTAKTQGIGAVVATMNEELTLPKSIRLNNTTVTSDDYLRTLPIGTYMVNASSGYIPISYGTVFIVRTNGGYGYAMAVHTETATVYIRHFYTNGWHGGWKQLVDTDALDTKINNLPFYQITKKVTSTSVPVTFTPVTNGRYVALVFSQANDSTNRSGVWVIIYKPSVTGSVTKLAGPSTGDAVPAVGWDTGVITISPGTWSDVKVLSTQPLT